MSEELEDITKMSISQFSIFIVENMDRINQSAAPEFEIEELLIIFIDAYDKDTQHR